MAANPKGHASFKTLIDLIDSGEEKRLRKTNFL